MHAFRFPALLVLLLLASPAQAHYHTLLPHTPSAKTDESITFTYQFGHPFEHQLFDTQKPTELYVITPEGTRIDLLPRLEPQMVDGVDGKKVTGYTFRFTPKTRGDYTVVAVSPEMKVEGESHPLRDIAKVVLHVQTQNGWDRHAITSRTAAVELSPLTRPYGLTPGMAFQVEVDEPAEGERKLLDRLEIQVEMANSQPPKELPSDEQITRSARTSRSGTAVVSLTEPGWWSITAIRARDKVQHRCTLWVHVDAKTISK